MGKIFAYFARVRTIFIGVMIILSVSVESAWARSEAASMGESLREAVERLPKSPTKAGLRRYLQILSPQSYEDDYSVSLGNQGIQSFFEHQFASNDCFAETAFRFYREVKKRNASEDRPTLKDVAGAGVHVKNEKGWVFRLALQFTKGDKNKAIALIGLCGHDDTNQGKYSNQRVENKLRSEGWDDEDLFSYEEGLEDYKLCPVQASEFYVPQSLGASADISSDLKQQIARIQAQGAAAALPAKYYHVMGSSFLTCQMIEAGLHPRLASSLQELAARAYRGIRLCLKTKYDYELFRGVLKDPIFQKRPAGVSLDRSLKETLTHVYLSSACLSSQKSSACPLLESISPDSLRPPPEDPGLRQQEIQRIHSAVDRLVTAGLYGSWYLGGNRFLKSLPCTDEQILGPHPLVQEWLETLNLQMNICGYGLSPEACRQSLKVIETWKMDFAWTVEQHRAGAKFAAENCSSRKLPGDSLANFCQ